MQHHRHVVNRFDTKKHGNVKKTDPATRTTKPPRDPLRARLHYLLFIYPVIHTHHQAPALPLAQGTAAPYTDSMDRQQAMARLPPTRATRQDSRSQSASADAKTASRSSGANATYRQQHGKPTQQRRRCKPQQRRSRQGVDTRHRQQPNSEASRSSGAAAADASSRQGSISRCVGGRKNRAARRLRRPKVVTVTTVAA